MNSSSIVYSIYIATSSEKLWNALTDSALLRQYWGGIESQFTVGSKVAEISDTGKLLWKGELLRSDPARLLSFTFDVTGSGEPPTEVTFQLEPDSHGEREAVRLTVTQAGFSEDSKLFAGCEHAWPAILSSLKTLLETGRPLKLF